MKVPLPHRDPLARQVAKTRAVLWTSALVVLGAVSARWWPMGDSATSIDPEAKTSDAMPSSGEADLPTKQPHLNLAAFDRAMWLMPVAPEVPKTASEKPAPPPPPLTLQLLGLVNEGGTTKAILYDSAADRVRVVAVGDALGDRTIERIDAHGVAIRDGVGLRTLALKGGAGGGP
ncbi:MAG: hypothetical protein IT434_10005 [Phycisphaerales bacterium]|nr:hypothetical protein [Phycisphaerales bacterium]